MSYFNWICPVCKQLLTLSGRTLKCDGHHAFDIAKEGYVNLLLAQHKKSKAPGDSKEMVVARQAFLASGAYAPLADELARLVLSHLEAASYEKTADQQVPLLLDLGCSEGYYSSYIQALVNKQSINMDVAGLDIAKPAIQKAARAHPGNHYCVGSSFDIPLPDDSVDIALQVFAPSSSQELARVLKPNALWICVEPAPQHLHELKAFVYKDVQVHESNAEAPEHFVIEASHTLSFSFMLGDAQSRLNLLKMTPYYWRISEDNKLRLSEQLRQCSADFSLKICRAL
ncbi:putative RNA methyltransferase [Glaciecola siphonariae]|uniref:RNA methyltransferase n=1 Tax=Glaciecola siphonariae TaxID=521012 RepID=A0ABV9LWV8_9ALTE